MSKLTMIHLSATVLENHSGMRLDQALALLFPDYSRSRLQAWLRQGQILVDAKHLKAKDKVWGGEEIVVNADLAEKSLPWTAQAIELNIIFEDNDLLIINKPPGIVVHPGAGNWEGTLVNALLHHAPELTSLPRAGLIHRLDKDTSGLLVVAKTLIAHTALTLQLQNRSMKREYEAVVNGEVIAGATIDAPIGRHPRLRKRMAIIESGKPAVTHYRVLERFRAHTLIKAVLETGRTHQIRVHLASVYRPVLGDMTYGGRLQLPRGASADLIHILRQFKRQALHARTLGLVHPSSGEVLEWQAPMPADMQNLINILRADTQHA